MRKSESIDEILERRRGPSPWIIEIHPAVLGILLLFVAGLTAVFSGAVFYAVGVVSSGVWSSRSGHSDVIRPNLHDGVFREPPSSDDAPKPESGV